MRVLEIKIVINREIDIYFLAQRMFINNPNNDSLPTISWSLYFYR